jgi:hypothetical protein
MMFKFFCGEQVFLVIFKKINLLILKFQVKTIYVAVLKSLVDIKDLPSLPYHKGDILNLFVLAWHF